MTSEEVVPSLGPLGIVAGILLTVLAGLLIEQLVHFISWRYKRATAGVAAIFAPLITSGPELAIFIVALLQGQAEIAWGTIVAQPFMTSTILQPVLLAIALISWFFKRRRYMLLHVHRGVIIPLLVFIIPLAPILVFHPEKYRTYGQLYGVVLLVLYALYARYMLKEEEAGGGGARLWLRYTALQIAAAIAAIYLGAEWIVSGIREFGETLGLDKVALSVILIPIATVVPETIVALIFIAKGEDEEGVNAVIGERALYSTFYPGLSMALGIYALEPAAITALVIAIFVSIVEIVIVWRFGYFGLSAPLGLASYVYYAYCYTLGGACF